MGSIKIKRNNELPNKSKSKLATKKDRESFEIVREITLKT